MESAPNQQVIVQTWAIVDVMGHQRYAGLMTEMTIAGHGFVRVDVPEVVTRHEVYRGGVYLDEEVKLPAFSKLFSPGAIHSISPVSEEVARAFAASVMQKPLAEFDIERMSRKQLPPAARDATPGGDDDDVPWDNSR